MRLFLVKFFLVLTLGLSLQGCETLKNFNLESTSTDEYKDWSEEKLHASAKEAMDDGYYQKAIKMYETLESRFPFGEHAAQAQLNIAYAYYKNDDSEAAIAAAERFIKIHPRNPSVDYAYYLKGLVNYNRDIGFLERFLPTDTSQRDPGSAREAYNNFQELISRFPDSQYIPDAQQRMIALRNNMAMHEVHAARFYLKRKAYVAAVNRASEVVNNYQRTTAVPFALEVMIEAYKKLGMETLANNASRVYDLNFPNGPPVPEKENRTMAGKVWDFIGFDR
ncbi:outer membrane protein assembly factor BamD [Methylotuvimicrobium sp. KM2]|uniref:outer membrane protein assembly factor BamD n=1 Tax=Methylotuvimicrobium sp. KM2 TaxID=3133976 RepID=UPI003100D25A